MEALLVLLVPIVLLWMALALARGRPLTPDAVLHGLARSSWRTLKWLWRDRPARGGAGQLRRPPFRYRR